MLNSWWFNLYTIHSLKKSLKWTLIALLVDFVGKNFAIYHLLPMSIFVIVAPFMPFMGHLKRAPSFRGNLAFHKMSVPLYELRKAFYSDFFITFFTALFLGIVVMGISMLFGGSASSAHSILNLLGTPELIFYVFLFMFFLLYLASFETSLEKRRLVYSHLSSSLFRQVITTVVIAPLVIISTTVAIIVTDGLYLAHLFFGAMLVGFFIHSRNHLFHLASEKLTYRGIYFKMFQGSVAVYSLMFVCSYFSSSLVLETQAPVSKRVSSFVFSGRFSPELDVETFKVVEPLLGAGEDGRLYSKLSFDPSALGIDYFLDKKSFSRLKRFISEGKPSPEFLTHLYDHLESNPYWKNKKSIEPLRYMAFNAWPKNTKLPERFLVSKQKSEQIYQQFKAEQKRKRQVASEEE